MTGEQLLKHMRAQPFKPFRMFLADGRMFSVDHPELLAYIPGGRTCMVADMADKTFDTVDLLLVTSISVSDENGGRGPRRRKR